MSSIVTPIRLALAAVNPARDNNKLSSTSLCRLLCVLVLCGFIHGCAQTNKVVADPGPSSNQPYSPNSPADAEPKYEPTSKLGNPPSYAVLGKRYYVMKQRKGFTERGIASWYGKKFHGRKTSNGEIYDMYAMTAAHKTLPLPAYVKVRNLQNGREVVVRVNDRGPFHAGRIIDLSYAAAKKLDIIRKGTGRVEIRDISLSKSGNLKGVQSAAKNRMFIQIGAFSDRSNADNLSDTIEHPNLPAIRVKADSMTTHPVYRVQLGPLDSHSEAEKVIEHLIKQGYTTSRLVFESPDQSAPVVQ